MKSFLFKDKVYFTGIILIGVSFGLFLFNIEFPHQHDFDLNGMFVVNYLLAIGYLIFLLISGRLRKGRNGLPVLMLFLVLSLVSCYALNEELNVFDESSTWFRVIIILLCINFMLVGWLDHFSNWMLFFFYGLAGIGLCVFLYLSLYLIPLYLVSIPGLLLLGISLHTFIPMLFCIYILIVISRTANRLYKLAFVLSVVFSIVFTTAYVVNWYINLKPINKHYQYLSITENNGLPGWVDVAQHLNKNSITEKILKTGIVYPELVMEGDFFWHMPQRNFGKHLHDPLVLISQFFCGKVLLDMEDRIKVLESIYDSRHEAQERLWTGSDIHTENVKTDIQIWPSFRMAYTEMNIILTHAPKDEFWANRQEGIYTFHLPEGSVVTSLSLWIDGREEKGILTSKGKADSAYKTIVGQEYRDPCVLHWQEGNTVSVRVFPILNGQSRKFKIGVTTPLKFHDQQLQYENIYFDGPDFSHAEEEIKVSMMENAKINNLPGGFQSSGNNHYERSGDYRPDWSISIDSLPVNTCGFQFGAYTYQAKPLSYLSESFRPQAVYLDLNASWTIVEANQVFDKLQDKSVFVSDGGEKLTQVTPENHSRLFSLLCKNQFSLFPFYKIPNPDESLVITHSGSVSPNMADLKNSEFVKSLSQYFSQHSSLHVFDFGNQESPYLKSLKEFRVLVYANGSFPDLLKFIREGHFSKVEESDDSVALTGARILLCRIKDSIPGKAPDHLMRLFAYNHILSKAGHQVLSGDQEPDDIVTEAQDANVVSPVSSLITLETPQDYERFKITQGENSLGNASLQAKGSVPEPAEWMLILAIVIFSGWIYYRPRFSTNFFRK